MVVSAFEWWGGAGVGGGVALILEIQLHFLQAGLSFRDRVWGGGGLPHTAPVWRSGVSTSPLSYISRLCRLFPNHMREAVGGET